jgi:hypothetical protein
MDLLRPASPSSWTHGIAAEEARLTGSGEWASWCRRREQRVVSAARDVLVVSPLSRDYVHRTYGKPLERVHVVPNGTDLSDRQAAFRTPLTVVYAGNLAPYENVMEFVRLAELGARDGFRFWLLGDGTLREPLFDYVNSRGVDLAYFGRKDRGQALDRCALAQAGFVGQMGTLDWERDPARHLCCPIKPFDYASRGLPVLAPRGEWSGCSREADAAVIVEACEARPTSRRGISCPTPRSGPARRGTGGSWCARASSGVRSWSRWRPSTKGADGLRILVVTAVPLSIGGRDRVPRVAERLRAAAGPVLTSARLQPTRSTGVERVLHRFRTPPASASRPQEIADRGEVPGGCALAARRRLRVEPAAASPPSRCSAASRRPSSYNVQDIWIGAPRGRRNFRAVWVGPVRARQGRGQSILRRFLSWRDPG